MGPATGMKTIWTTGRFEEEKIFQLTLDERDALGWDHDPALAPARTSVLRLRAVRPGPFGGRWRLDLLAGPPADGAREAPQRREGLQRRIRPDRMRGPLLDGDGRRPRGEPETAGRTLPGNDVAIFDDEGKRLPDGVDGNICVRGPNVMLGYWRNEAATKESFFDDGWLRTGDIGQMRDGLLYLASRKRDMIIRGGENVYPTEIENRIDDHPAVEESRSSASSTGRWARRSRRSSAPSRPRTRRADPQGLRRRDPRLLQGPDPRRVRRRALPAQRDGQDPQGRVDRRSREHLRGVGRRGVRSIPRNRVCSAAHPIHARRNDRCPLAPSLA